MSEELVTHPRWDWTKADGAQLRRPGSSSTRRARVELVEYWGGKPGPTVRFREPGSANLLRLQDVAGWTLDLANPATQGVLLGMLREAWGQTLWGSTWVKDRECLGEAIALALLDAWGE